MFDIIRMKFFAKAFSCVKKVETFGMYGIVDWLDGCTLFKLYETGELYIMTSVQM